MGVIKRQGIKQSIAAYVGVGLGMLNILFIYPAFLTEAQIGVINTLRDTAFLVVPFVFLGCNALTIRFFPAFKEKEKGHHGFLFFLISILLIGLILFFVIAFFFWDQIPQLFADKGDLFLDYFYLVLPFVVLLAFCQLLTNYTANFRRIVFPFIFNELFVKVGQPLLALALAWELLTFSGVVQGVVWLQGIILTFLIGYLIVLKQLHLKPSSTKLKKPLLKEMSVYAGYGILGGLGSRLATRIDAVMLTTLLGSGFSGIFFVSRTIGDVVDAPRRAISKISGPIIAQSMNDGDLGHVEDLYKRSSLNLLIIGLFLLLGIWLSVEQLFELIPNGERFVLGKYVVLFIGLTNVINMATGLNEEIITYSKYFRYKFYFILALAVFNVVTNYLLIPAFGITGAAMATMASMSLYNLLKFILLKMKLNIHPFSKETLYVLVIGLCAYTVSFFLPTTEWVLVTIILKSVVFSIFFGGAILYFKISTDVNDLVQQGIQKGKQFLNKR